MAHEQRNQDEVWKDDNLTEANFPADEHHKMLSSKPNPAELQGTHVWPEASRSETVSLQQPPLMTTAGNIGQAQSSRQSVGDQASSAILFPLSEQAASASVPFNQQAQYDLSATSFVNSDAYKDLYGPPPPLAPIVEANEVANDNDKKRIKALYDCSIGEYPCLWYKFRRFESLSLFNIYLLQDRIVKFEMYVRRRCVYGGTLSDDDIEKQNHLLKEYHEALCRFREISQMKRPSTKQREEASQALTNVVDPDYDAAPDSMGMVDLIPATLGVEPDPIRLLMHEWLQSSTTQSPYVAYTNRVPGAHITDEEPISRPYQIISTKVDSMARIVVAIMSALFLVAPMLALSYINAKWARLLTASLFILLFCIITSAAPQAKNHEVIMMTAAYAAVIVVFVGQTS